MIAERLVCGKLRPAPPMSVSGAVFVFRILTIRREGSIGRIGRIGPIGPIRHRVQFLTAADLLSCGALCLEKRKRFQSRFILLLGPHGLTWRSCLVSAALAAAAGACFGVCPENSSMPTKVRQTKRLLNASLLPAQSLV